MMDNGIKQKLSELNNQDKCCQTYYKQTDIWDRYGLTIFGIVV